MQFWTIVGITIKEIRAKKLFWINLGLTVLVVSGMACWGFDDNGPSFLWYSFEHSYWNTTHELFRTSICYTVVSGLLISFYIGWVGTVMGLVSTAGNFPAMMERGAIDLLLARPVSRRTIFLAKYVGGLFFMAVQGTLFVVSTFLVIGLRWHLWLPGYLWSIPLLILLFSYLYCLCTLFGVWTRSALASILLTMAAWLVFFGVQSMHQLAHTFPEVDQWPRIKRTLVVLNWIVPNTSEIPMIAQQLMDDTDLTSQASSPIFNQPGVSQDQLHRALSFEGNVSRYYSIGSSLLFEIAILLIACWRFSKEDF